MVKKITMGLRNILNHTLLIAAIELGVGQKSPPEQFNTRN